MTKSKIKNEIQKILGNIPENVLQDIHNLLKELQRNPKNITLTRSIHQIMLEDKELLEKLAK